MMKQMRITKAILEEAITLQNVIKSSQSRLDEINAALKERGSFSMGVFTVAVSEVERKQVAGLKTFLEHKFKEKDMLDSGLLKIITYKTVKICEQLEVKPAAQDSSEEVA